MTVDNPAAALALAQAASWVGTIAPERVTQFVEEDARITFERGNAAFMRNWPYAWALLEADDSPSRARSGWRPCPRAARKGSTARRSAAGSSRSRATPPSRRRRSSSSHYLTGEAEQKRRAVEGAFAPTIKALYDDPDVLAANPFFADLDEVLRGRRGPPVISRPARTTRRSRRCSGRRRTPR